MSDISQQVADQLRENLDDQHQRYQELRRLTAEEQAALASGRLDDLQALTGRTTGLMHDAGSIHASLVEALALLASADAGGERACRARAQLATCLEAGRRASAELVRLMAEVEQRRDEAMKGLAAAGSEPAMLVDVRG